jgi:hypothetical protein
MPCTSSSDSLDIHGTHCQNTSRTEVADLREWRGRVELPKVHNFLWLLKLDYTPASVDKINDVEMHFATKSNAQRT